MADNSTDISPPLSGPETAALVLGIIVALLLVVIGILVCCVCRYRYRLASPELSRVSEQQSEAPQLEFLCEDLSSDYLNPYENIPQRERPRRLHTLGKDLKILKQKVETQEEEWPERLEVLDLRQSHADFSYDNQVDLSPDPVAEPMIEKTTVQLWGRQATIVGGTKTLSQVYSASQSYFSTQGNWREDDNFIIPSNRLTIQSALFAEDLPDGQLSDGQLPGGQSGVAVPSQRPTSYINLMGADHASAADSHVPYVGQKEIFKHSVLGPAGGTIEFSGITLEVPAGALGKEIEISIGVTWDTNKYPRLSNEEALLSPVVVCEPHGTVFTKAVKLSFPHCAVDDLMAWMPKLMQSQTRIDSAPDWRVMTVGDYSERSFASKVVTVGIKHFTLYSLVAEPKDGQRVAKDVKLLAFAPHLKTGKLHKIRIYCVENYEKEMKEIEPDEELLGGRRVHPKKSIFIHNTGENLCLESHLESAVWKLIGDQSVELQYEQIWHGLTPNHEFAFTTEANADFFHSKFSAYQRGYESHCQVLNISEQSEEPVTDPWKVSTGLIPRELRLKLVMLLEPPNVSGNNWQMFADHIGLSASEIRYLENQESPVDLVLNKWESLNQSLVDLHQIMLNLNRDDAAMEIDRRRKDEASSGDPQ